MGIYLHALILDHPQPLPPPPKHNHLPMFPRSHRQNKIVSFGRSGDAPQCFLKFILHHPWPWPPPKKNKNDWSFLTISDNGVCWYSERKSVAWKINTLEKSLHPSHPHNFKWEAFVLPASPLYDWNPLRKPPCPYNCWTGARSRRAGSTRSSIEPRKISWNPSKNPQTTMPHTTFLPPTIFGGNNGGTNLFHT